jgi:hypothetical protein
MGLHGGNNKSPTPTQTRACGTPSTQFFLFVSTVLVNALVPRTQSLLPALSYQRVLVHGRLQIPDRYCLQYCIIGTGTAHVKSGLTPAQSHVQLISFNPIGRWPHHCYRLSAQDPAPAEKGAGRAF